MSDAWWYAEGENRMGPVRTRDLGALLRGSLPAGTLVWREGFPDWKPADQVPEFRAWLAPPLAAAASHAAGEEAPTWNPIRLVSRSLATGGRFDRNEYLLANLTAMAPALLIEGLAFWKTLSGEPALVAHWQTVVRLVWILTAPIWFFVGIGSILRRLNDLGKPGWWLVGAFLPGVNAIVGLYLLFTPGEPWTPGSARSPGGPAPPAAGRSVASTVVLVGGLGCLGVMGLGIVAAIVVPSLARARQAANEAGALGDLRAMVAAQKAYALVNGSFFEGDGACLSAPTRCLAGYKGAPLLDPAVVDSARNGYRWEIYRGQVFAPGTAPLGRSPSSTNAFAFVGVPLSDLHGRRLFCADSWGALCAADTGPPAQLVEQLPSTPWVRCASRCQPLP
ncbi:MAG: GYF domain-containing protein [Vicinamibacteria bacterium]|nr:GYF domain-containing protein [Vicinamibacteria bacterium]